MKRFPTIFTRIASITVPTVAALGVTMVPVVQAQPALGESPQQPNAATTKSTTYPALENLPEGVSVDHVDWLSPHHIAIFIKSAAMPDKLIQVQMLLARDWYANPNAKFPELWALDGLRATDENNGWTTGTNIIQQYADKNVNVILPVGGESSFYTDWEKPNNGKNYQWESFFTKELVPILKEGFRSNGTRGIVGLSMGGTAAMNLAERNPSLFNFVGSFSGYLDTTTQGMPEAIQAAQEEVGGYDATAMWGPLYSENWAAHDPKLGIDALKNMTVYVSSGSGHDDFGSPESIAKGPASAAGIGLELIARMSTQTFVDYAEKTNTKVISRFRESGVHTWEYWQYELNEAWPFIADALNLSEADRGAQCQPIGDIAQASQSGEFGNCLTNEYDVAGGNGKAEDFRGGTAYWSKKTGAQLLIGDINAQYASLGGPQSWLGFPESSEIATDDGVGRYVRFEGGSIYWSPKTGAHAIPRDMLSYWGSKGWQKSDLGYPVSGVQDTNGGKIQRFENGLLVQGANGDKKFITQPQIADKYVEVGAGESDLGFPKSETIAIPGGFLQEFDHGNIYWSEKTGAHTVLYGDIFDHWGKTKWEQGPFGFPTSDMKKIPAGGLTIDFQGGTITQINGVIQEKK